MAAHLYSGRSSSIKPPCSRTDYIVAPQRKSVGTKTKMLEHPQSSPPIANCPTRPRTEKHSCWLDRGTPTQSGRIHSLKVQHKATLLDAANSAAAPASREAASRQKSAVVQDIPASHTRDLHARHWINVNSSGRFPSERLRPGTPAEARDLAITSLRWWSLTVLPGARFQTRLVKHTKFQSQPDSNCNSDCLVVKLQAMRNWQGLYPVSTVTRSSCSVKRCSLNGWGEC